MKRVLLVSKAGHEEAYSLAATIRDWLHTKGAEGLLLVGTLDTEKLRHMAEGADLVCVLGGDGTFIGAARRLVGRHTPLVGINFGRLGFLTAIGAEDWEPLLQQCLDGTLKVKPRMALAWELERGGKSIASGNAVNDLVLARGALARVISLHLSLSDGEDVQPIGWVRSDGIIVSTPQGSSAYSFSAKGSLVHPSLSCLHVTAISPFLNSLPPLVLPGENTLHFALEPKALDVHLTIDGQEALALCGNDKMHIRSVPDGVYCVSPGKDTYFSTLCRRGFIREFRPEPEQHTLVTGGGHDEKS